MRDSRALRIAVLALGYYVTGKIGLLLAIPPGYATAVWPPSAIALAGILAFGYRAWPGVLLGSFWLNVPTSFDGTSVAALFKSLAIPVTIGGGASLQAAAGAYLVRRWGRYPNPLDRVQDVARFLLLGGPVACLINATLSVGVLLAMGTIKPAEAPFTWGTWWAGDTIAVLVLTPVLLPRFGNRAGSRSPHSTRRIAVAGPLLLAFILFAVSFFIASRRDQYRARTEFGFRASAITEAVKKRLIADSEPLELMANLLSIAAPVDRFRVHELAKQVIRRHPRIRSLEWVPYSPKQRLEGALASSRDTGATFVSRPSSEDIRVDFPIYGTGNPRPFKGFVVGVFRLNDILAGALQGLDRSGIEARLDDAPWHPPDASLIWSAPLDFFDRGLRLVLWQPTNYQSAHRSWVAWMLLVAGLLFCGLLGALLLVLTGRTDRAFRLAEQRAAELEQAGRALAEQQRRLIESSRMSALGEMASGIAHEINNPLQIILVHASLIGEFLKRPDENRGKIAAKLQGIEETVERITRIIDGLQAFAREGSADPFQRASFREIVESTLSFCQERFARHGVLVQVDEIPGGASLTCRPGQIEQVLLNLLNNAYQAVLPLEERWIQISFQDSGDSVGFSVTDSGRGIPPVILERIFQPFFTTKPVGSGTGLGLSISKGIVESHEGRLYVDVSCRNTRFEVSLPKKFG